MSIWIKRIFELNSLTIPVVLILLMGLCEVLYVLQIAFATTALITVGFLILTIAIGGVINSRLTTTHVRENFEHA